MEASQIYKLFGQRVSSARGHAGLTQHELAVRVGLSRASIANIEAGRQRIVLHQAIELAEALGVSSVTELLPSDLFRLDVRTTRPPEVRFTGSRVSRQEADNIARIVESS